MTMDLGRFVDAAYLSLSALTLAGLAVAGFICRRGLRRTQGRERRYLSGLVVTALGMGIALIGGVLTSALLKHSTLYQQIRFSLFYLGFAMIVWGFVRMMRAGARTGATAVHPSVPNTLAVVFGASVGIALGFLLTPSTYAVNDFGDQAQLPIYFMPLMIASGGGALIFVGLAARGQSRDRSTWVGLFALAVLVGVVQEAGVVPTVGDSFLGILGIFIPFAVGAWLLPLAAVGPEPVYTRPSP